MKKRLIATLTIFVMSIVSAFALAASVKGSVWTGKPNELGFGYYCTAAQNQSPKGINRRAYARTDLENGTSVESSARDNNHAVASTGYTKPVGGYGKYSEKGGSGSATFGRGAYD